MHRRKLIFIFIAVGMLLVVSTGLWLATAQPALAQCGSQASSCKNCHEVQGQKPVNNDGTPWHTSHAFGDFCYICHGGNQQATDKVAAHTGMVSPLSDIKASCQSCHPNDLQARAQVYADKLGIQIGAGNAPSTSSSSNAAPAASPTASSAPAASNTSATPQAATAPQQAGFAPNDPNLVNYVERYNENVLGEYPTNWGNVILLVMIGALLIGGGALVISHEGLVKVSFKETKPVTGEYPADVVDMVPEIAKLKPAARKALHRLLEKPEATAEVLTSIDKLAEDKSADQKEQ